MLSKAELQNVKFYTEHTVKQTFTPIKNVFFFFVKSPWNLWHFATLGQGAGIEVDVPGCRVALFFRVEGDPSVQVVQSYVNQKPQPVDQEQVYVKKKPSTCWARGSRQSWTKSISYSLPSLPLQKNRFFLIVNFWNHLNSFGLIRILLDSFVVIWNSLDPSGLISAHLDSSGRGPKTVISWTFS